MSVEGRVASGKLPSFTTHDGLLENLQHLAVPARPDMSMRDYVVQLLSFGAHVEHALMVQYLFAAYSLPADSGDARVERWRASILSVAREEMGHLLTVQNVLTLLGAPTDFGREYSPWAAKFFPFPFSLEPFSHDVLVRYIHAESPSQKELDEDETNPPGRTPVKTYAHDDADVAEAIAADIERQGLAHTGQRVGKTYEAIIRLLSNPAHIPDFCFDEASYERQASFDEWGRNYRPPPRQLDPEGDKEEPPAKPDPLPPPSGRDAYVQVRRVATRSDAIQALRDLSEQGEAPHLGLGENSEPSHYERFVEIYREQRERPIPESHVVANPTTRYVRTESDNLDYHYIDVGRAHCLAQIFNQRYRLLLNYLAHTFRIDRPARFDRPNLRSMLMHRAFAEMYNLKTLAGLLVQLPINEKKGEKRMAGPPFEAPPSLVLPMREIDIWRSHRELIGASDGVMQRFLDPEGKGVREFTSDKVKGTAAQAFLRTMLQIDTETLKWIETILIGSGAREANF